MGVGQGRRNIPPEDMEKAMEVYQREGVNAAMRASGIDKKTIKKHADERGLKSPASQQVRDQAALASLRAAQVRSRKVNEKIDRGIDRTINLLELAQAKEIQVLLRIEPDKLGKGDLKDALSAITRSRTTAVKDMEMLLRRAGMLVGSADGGDVIEVVRHCVRGALEDVGLPTEMREAFSKAFADRLREAQGAEEDGPAAIEAGDAEEPDVEDAEPSEED